MESTYRPTRTSREKIEYSSVFLQPIAAPLILGLGSFAAAAIMWGANLAHWYGSSSSPLFLAPFLGALGITQIAAALFAYRARDGLATGLLGGWGAFWLGFAVLQFMLARGIVPQSGLHSPEFGFWLIALAGLSLSATLAAFLRSAALSLTLVGMTASAVLGAVGYFVGSNALLVITGYALIATAIIAWYTATAKMLESTYARDILPLGRPLSRSEREFQEMLATEPGVKRGE